MQTAEYRVQKHILCYNNNNNNNNNNNIIIIVSDTDLTTNFIDMRAPHQNSPEHLAFLFCQSSIPYMVLYTVILLQIAMASPGTNFIK